jgi:dienelactone hydrolase
MRIVSRILAIIAFVVAVAVFALVGWSLLGPSPGPDAEAALVSDTSVTVETEPWLTFDPGDATTGLVIYPGGRIEPEAYAPVARRIAEAGFLVVVPEMPLDFAVFAPSRANDVIAAHPEIDHWVVGGHSLGGAMAATFTELTFEVDGLVMWAAYPAGSVDLAGRDIASIALLGTEDGLVDADEVDSAISRMPPGYLVVPIEGGNHAQFGDYGPQRGDGEATIEPMAQWDIVADVTIGVLLEVTSG